MSRNRNKRAYRIQTGGTPVTEVLLEVDGDDEPEADQVGPADPVNKSAAAPQVPAAAEAAAFEDLKAPLFLPITKVDEVKREVWGRAAQEVPDYAGEIMDYVTAKPNFKKWSDDAIKRSNGKSKGNLRAMHQPIAAGRVIDLQFNDTEKAIDVGTHVTDDKEWEKVLDGTYTGFSLGGKYERRWADPNNYSLIRYTPKPGELSLVDAPAIPTATYTLIKADGSSETRPLGKALPASPSAAATQTIVDTRVTSMPAPPAPVAINAADMQPSGGKFAAATNPNAASVALDIAGAVNPSPSDGPNSLGNGPAAQLAAAATNEDKVATRRGFATNGQKAACGCDCAGCAAGNHCKAAACSVGKLIEMGQRVGIARRDGQAVAVPADFESSTYKHYGDPANLAWPVVAGSAEKSLSDYNGGTHRTLYSTQEWAVLGRRLARLAGAVTGKLHRYDPRTKRVIKENPMAAPAPDLKTSLANARALMTAGTQDGSDQAAAILDGLLDSLTTRPDAAAAPAVTNPQAVTIPVATTPATQQPQKEAPPTAGNSTPGVASTTGDNSATSSPSTPKPSVPTTAGKVDNMNDFALLGGDLNKNAPAPVSQAVGPLATTPPSALPADAPYLALVDGSAWIEKKLPEFVSLLADTPKGRGYEPALKLAGSDQSFSALYQTGMRRLLDGAGFNSRNLDAGDPRLFRKAMFGFLGVENDDVRKGINAAFAPNIYLQRLIKLMLPVATLLRSRLPIQSNTNGGVTAQWRAQLGFSKFLSATAMSTAEADITIGTTGGTGQVINETALSFAAPFVFTADSNVVTLGAIAAERGYDDPMQVAIIQSLVALLRTEEMNILFANTAAVAQPASVTATPQNSGGTLVTGNYTAKVTSLTGRGWRYTQEVPSYIGSGTYTVVTSNDTVTAGESTNRAATLQAVTGPNGSLQLFWAAVPNAVAYNVYCLGSAQGVERWIATVTPSGTVNNLAYTITAFPGAGNVAATADTTANTNGYEGLLSWASLATIYSAAIPNKTVIDQLGKALTLVGNNSIAEFDTVLKNLWVNWQTAPTLIVCSPQSALHAAKIIGSATNPPQRIELAGMQGGMVGGVFATGYINKFAPYMPGIPRVIDIMAHPYMADGTYMFISEAVNYQMAREGRGFLLEAIIPYTYFPLGALAPNYPFTTLVQETLECYNPGAQAVIQGVNVA